MTPTSSPKKDNNDETSASPECQIKAPTYQRPEDMEESKLDQSLVFVEEEGLFEDSSFDVDTWAEESPDQHEGIFRPTNKKEQEAITELRDMEEAKHNQGLPAEEEDLSQESSFNVRAWAEESSDQHEGIFQLANGEGQKALPKAHHGLFTKFILKLLSCGGSQNATHDSNRRKNSRMEKPSEPSFWLDSTTMAPIDLPVVPEISMTAFKPFAEDAANALHEIRLADISIVHQGTPEKGKGKLSKSWSKYGRLAEVNR